MEVLLNKKRSCMKFPNNITQVKVTHADEIRVVVSDRCGVAESKSEHRIA